MEDNKDAPDKWFRQVVEFVNNNIVPKNFIGHCCELKSKIKDNMKIEDHITTNPIKYDGYLHFPQVDILLDTPLVTHVDVHGLGKEDPLQGTPGLLHGVVDKECAINCFKDNIVPLGVKSNCMVSYKSSLLFDDMFDRKTRLRYHLEVFEINDCLVQETRDLKHSRPSPSHVQSSSLLKNDMNDIDVWIILGKPKNTDSGCHLINMRWKSNLDYKKWTNGNNVKGLYDSLLSKCSNNGMQVQRSGGSNGLTSINNTDILQLISTNCAFPRKGKGVKVVRKRTKWKCYYVGVRKNKNEDTKGVNKNFVSWNYQQPQRGGNFKLDPTLKEKYDDIISAMTIAKYNSALLSKRLSGMFLTMHIQDKAVESSLNDIKDAKISIDEKMKKKYCLRSQKLKEEEYYKQLVTILSMKNKFTLVAYPCGYHFDVFDKKAHSLENKICFSFDTTLNKDNSDIGRGGNGCNKFVFAILDWTNN